MSKKHVERVIHALNSTTRSIDSQIAIAHYLWDEGYKPNSDGIKRSTIDDEIGGSLGHTVRTSLGHLEAPGIIDEYLERESVYVIAEWHPDVFIMGQVEEAANQGIAALVDDLEDYGSTSGSSAVATDGSGPTRRQVVADHFDVHPRAVEDHLTRGDPVERLNEAVEAIQDSDHHETGDDYGEVVFRNPAYRYRLSEVATKLYEL